MTTRAEFASDPTIWGGKWEHRPLFAREADVTVYWPDVRPCYDNEQDDTKQWEDR